MGTCEVYELFWQHKGNLYNVRWVILNGLIGIHNRSNSLVKKTLCSKGQVLENCSLTVSEIGSRRARARKRAGRIRE